MGKYVMLFWGAPSLYPFHFLFKYDVGEDIFLFTSIIYPQLSTHRKCTVVLENYGLCTYGCHLEFWVLQSI